MSSERQRPQKGCDRRTLRLETTARHQAQGVLQQNPLGPNTGPPITPQGQFVSSFIHEINIPGNPVTPGDLISDFVHSVQTPGEPNTPQIVSDFVHDLHNPITDCF